MTATDTHTHIQRTIDAVWRIESAKLIASLARMVRDVGLAEELAQDALVVALEQWPQSGVPDNPGAWLMTTAKHRAIDRLRRSKLQQRKHEELGRSVVRRAAGTNATTLRFRRPSRTLLELPRCLSPLPHTASCLPAATNRLGKPLTF